MGKGKGEPEYWAAVVKAGHDAVRVGRRDRGSRRKMCFARLAHKMPVRVRMVKRRPAKYSRSSDGLIEKSDVADDQSQPNYAR